MVGNPFLKAMEISKGTVSILDKDCVVYSRIWCIYAKSLKNEINAEEFRQCSGYHLVGWLSQHRAEWPVCLVPYLDELVKSLEEEC